MVTFFSSLLFLFHQIHLWHFLFEKKHLQRKNKKNKSNINKQSQVLKKNENLIFKKKRNVTNFENVSF